MPAARRKSRTSERDVSMKRPHDNAGARMDAAQAARSCAAQQPKKKRFGLIVFRVRDGNRGRAEARRRAIEERIARGVRRVFD